MHRFYCPDTHFSKNSVTLNEKDEIHHLKNVLRLTTSDTLFLFNGTGGEAKGKVERITNQKIEIAILETSQKSPLLPEITLACAIPKKTKFEWIVEKCVELGVSKVIPLETKRTQLNLSASGKEKKLKRYRTVAVNAAKQSQQAFLPKIEPVTGYKEAIQNAAQNPGTILIPSLVGERKELRAALEETKTEEQEGRDSNPGTLTIFIGPEGDFTPEEYQLAFEHKAVPVSLGETILKVETAAIASLSFIRLFFHQT